MINYFYRCEINNEEMKTDDNPDIRMMVFVSRNFMSQQALQDSIIADFTTRMKKAYPKKVDITSIREVSPYITHNMDELEAKTAEDAGYDEYVNTWDPDGAESRFTFVLGDHYDTETDSLTIEVPPKTFMARYQVSSFEDNFSFIAPSVDNINSCLH